MADDLDFIINTNKIEVKHIRILKVKQSIESIFFVLFFFTIMTTIGDQLIDRSSKQITEIKKAVEDTKKENIPFDNTLKIADVQDIPTTKIIKVKKRENIYVIFKAEGIPYNDKNLEKIKNLNPKVKSLKKIRTGTELVFPVKWNSEKSEENTKK